MNFWHYLKTGFILLLIIILATEGILAFLNIGYARWTVYTGVAISFGNAVLGFAAISWGFHRSHQKFMLSVYGSMIFRFLLIFSLLFILIGAFNLDTVPLVSSLMISYFLFLGLEIVQIHKLNEPKKEL